MQVFLRVYLILECIRCIYVVIFKLKREIYGLKTIKRIADSLKKGGHQIKTFEGDKDIIKSRWGCSFVNNEHELAEALGMQLKKGFGSLAFGRRNYTSQSSSLHSFL